MEIIMRISMKDSPCVSVVIIMAILTLITLFTDNATGRETDSQKMGRGELLQKVLGLSVEQVEQLQAFRSDNREAMQRARQELIDARQQFRTTATQLTEEEAIREAFQPVTVALENMAILRVVMSKQRKSILTPEQLEQFQALRQVMRRNDGPGKSRHRQVYIDLQGED
jgi:Spy/CpxP family protein refolding chaperone